MLRKNTVWDEIQKDILTQSLDAMWNIETKFVSRPLYVWLPIEKTLVEIWNWRYELLLANDLTSYEKIKISNFLNQKFNLNQTSEIEEIKSNIKIWVLYILEWLKENIKAKNWENQDIKNFKKKLLNQVELKIDNSIPYLWIDFVNDIRKSKINFTQAKNLIKELRKISTFKEKIDFIQEKFINDISLNFEHTIADFWRNSLKNNIQTYNQSNYEVDDKVKRYYDEINSKKTTETATKVVFNTSKEELDKENILLRQKLEIDKYKSEIEKNKNNPWKQDEIKLEFTNKLFKELLKYPYYNTNESQSHEINEAITQKHLFCNSMCNLAYSIFSELWIETNAMISTGHIDLEVIIWWKHYLFDVINKDKIIESDISKQKKDWSKNEFVASEFENLKLISEQYKYILVDSQTWILSWLYQNISNSLQEKNPKLALEYNNLWLNLTPSNPDLYKLRWIILEKISNQNYFKNLYDFIEKWLNGSFDKFEFRDKKIKKVLREFIEKRNYEWLRDFVINTLEK